MVVLMILAILAVGLSAIVGIHVLRREYFPLLSELEKARDLESSQKDLSSENQEKKEGEQ